MSKQQKKDLHPGLTVSKATFLADPCMEEAHPGYEAQLIVRQIEKRASTLHEVESEDHLTTSIKQSPETIMKFGSTSGKPPRPKTRTLEVSHSTHGTTVSSCLEPGYL